MPDRVVVMESGNAFFSDIRFGVRTKLDSSFLEADEEQGARLSGGGAVAEGVGASAHPLDAGGTRMPPSQVDTGGPARRMVVDYATGMVMARLDVDVTVAEAGLRSYAREARRPLLEVARDVVARRVRLS